MHKVTALDAFGAIWGFLFLPRTGGLCTGCRQQTSNVFQTSNVVTTSFKHLLLINTTHLRALFCVYFWLQLVYTSAAALDEFGAACGSQLHFTAFSCFSIFPEVLDQFRVGQGSRHLFWIVVSRVVLLSAFLFRCTCCFFFRVFHIIHLFWWRKRRGRRPGGVGSM